MIHVIAVLPVSRKLLADLASDVSAVFPVAVHVKNNGLELRVDAAYDPSRKQFNASLLLAALLEAGSSLEGKLIGVTGVDLFIPVLTYVIGEAQLNGRATIMSAYRLHEELYGLPANHGLLRERVFKEALHELGHTFGLVHCRDPICVMRSSAAVEEIDIKGSEFCTDCRRMISPEDEGNSQRIRLE